MKWLQICTLRFLWHNGCLHEATCALCWTNVRATEFSRPLIHLDCSKTFKLCPKGQVTRAQEAEENYLIKRELATMKQQNDDSSGKLERARHTISELQQQQQLVRSPAALYPPLSARLIHDLLSCGVWKWFCSSLNNWTVWRCWFIYFFLPAVWKPMYLISSGARITVFRSAHSLHPESVGWTWTGYFINPLSSCVLGGQSKISSFIYYYFFLFIFFLLIDFQHNDRI